MTILKKEVLVHLVVIVYFCKVLAVAADSPPSYTQEYLAAQYRLHAASVKTFRCDVPRERSIQLQDVLGTAMETNEIYEPHVTVLHRCDEKAGVCLQTDQFRCAMNTEETVVLEFKVTNIDNNYEVRSKWVNAKNHTSCTCQDIVDLS